MLDPAYQLLPMASAREPYITLGAHLMELGDQNMPGLDGSGIESIKYTSRYDTMGQTGI